MIGAKPAVGCTVFRKRARKGARKRLAHLQSKQY